MLSASSLGTQGGVAYPIAVTISGQKPSSLDDFFLSIIASKEAIAPPYDTTFMKALRTTTTLDSSYTPDISFYHP
uniref:Uncharacterized protein n=1 Tax=Utricularia reniformis TaxID=192314 RepID=A0A1Y0B3T2_9LAMI|nr:hypothetical protein AEK19_MT1953 [Utricularia reniformis]ART32115.1 hypothetical protein AEK19_MT1953 [Utricularia reniformis]